MTVVTQALWAEPVIHNTVQHHEKEKDIKTETMKAPTFKRWGGGNQVGWVWQ